MHPIGCQKKCLKVNVVNSTWPRTVTGPRATESPVPSAASGTGPPFREWRLSSLHERGPKGRAGCGSSGKKEGTVSTPHWISPGGDAVVLEEGAGAASGSSGLSVGVC